MKAYSVSKNNFAVKKINLFQLFALLRAKASLKLYFDIVSTYVNFTACNSKVNEPLGAVRNQWSIGTLIFCTYTHTVLPNSFIFLFSQVRYFCIKQNLNQLCIYKLKKIFSSQIMKQRQHSQMLKTCRCEFRSTQKVNVLI